MLGIISTIKDKCRQCYSCVRNCPVKAVKVQNGQAEILYDRCINCGNCVKVCSQNAKYIQRDVEKVLGMIKKGEKVVACLAPSFPAVIGEFTPNQLAGALKGVGFYQVREVSFGAQIMAEEYVNLFKKWPNKKTMISTPCPAVVNLVERHYPALLPNLAPIVSPMEAIARYVKLTSCEPLKVVFIGPCVAKKEEAQNSLYVDEALTFDEMFEIIEETNFIDKPVEAPFDGPEPSHKPRAISISGGLLHAVGETEDVLRSEILIVEGKEDCISIIESLIEKKISPRFIDMLFCKGCIDGPILKKTNVFSNQYAVSKFIFKNEVEYRQPAEPFKKKIDLTRSFYNKKKSLPIPGEEEIRKILEHTNKRRPEDELNCGACGYSSCREKAVAVFQGIAEIEMCLPYLLEKVSSELETIKELNEELDAIIESSYDGIWLADSNGNTLRVNRAFCRLVGLKREELIGEKTAELEKKGVIFPSVTNLVLREKRRVTVIQETKLGKKLLTTGNPIFNEHGEITLIMINARDFTELNRLSQGISETKKLKEYLQSRESIGAEIQPAKVIAFSQKMENILQLAAKIADVDSTVFILGESGVGKEVIARFIHKRSHRDKGPFVKINCGAIPETLLESELFGYETGAFTGAKRQGKPGLIEMANEGTLFLDEIGELPLNLQVKLLQVLQEHRLVRIGGIKPITVNIRVIAATNRDIENMVKKGEFREDLFYRLNVVPITIPPLRERRDDIIPLIYHFLEEYNRKYDKAKKISAEAKDILIKYNWPGNVRELENTVERLVVTVEEDVILPHHLPENLKEMNIPLKAVNVDGIMPLKDAVEMVERQLLHKAVEQCNSTYDIAKILGVNQSTVVRKIQKYGIKLKRDHKGN